MGAITWEIERIVKEAQQQEPDPGTGPDRLLFIPTTVRSRVIHWAHTARFSCHPGKNRTISFLQRLFWWSHIAVDFVTGLPSSSGNTTILTIIDRFSKAAHFVALTKLPTALETAQLLTQHVFRLHGIPQDIVSEWGPQFTSQVWRAFCSELGAKVSLSSGFHPQTNGQAERANQELETMLRCVVSSNQSTWSDQLAWIELTIPARRQPLECLRLKRHWGTSHRYLPSLKVS